MSHLPSPVYAALPQLQRIIGDANAEKGFHEEGDELRHLDKVNAAAYVGREEQRTELLPSAVRNYWTARLALITTEVAEAIEELRNGRAVDETYYPSAHPFDLGPNAKPTKPEGVPSEVADIVIRAFDFAHEAGIDLAAIIEEKLSFNATRAHKHGRAF